MTVEEWKRKNPPIQRKNFTNADYVRQMNDEELAEWISCNCTGDGYGNSAEDWLNWLKQEYTTFVAQEYKKDLIDRLNREGISP